MKRAGSFHDIPIFVDPDAPRDIIFLVNENMIKSERDLFKQIRNTVYAVDSRTKWQRFKDWLLRRYV